MPVSFQLLQIGQTYDRPYLAGLWGYQTYHAISRGVVTPQGTNYIILFVTKVKQESQTQYNDFIDDGYLFWEGEEKHGTDLRIIDARKNRDEIHLFYRDIHHTPFVYMGPVQLLESQKGEDSPSEFIFSIGINAVELDTLEDIETKKNEWADLPETVRKEIVKSRIGQGQFRKKLIKMWGGCSVTGLGNLSLLTASHIKPWRSSSNQERLDPNNGLLLTPNYDHLFDRGFISFKNSRDIILSTDLREEEQQTLRIDDRSKLRIINMQHQMFLEYHRDCIFRG